IVAGVRNLVLLELLISFQCKNLCSLSSAGGGNAGIGAHDNKYRAIGYLTGDCRSYRRSYDERADIFVSSVPTDRAHIAHTCILSVPLSFERSEKRSGYKH